MSLRAPPFRLLLAQALGLSALALGCAREAEERNLTEMTSQIERMQVERDEAIRQALGTDVADTHFSSVPPRTPAPGQVAPPPVWIGGDGTPEGEPPDTEDPTPRPTIRVVGSPRSGRAFDSSSMIDESPPPPSSGAPRSSVLDPEAKPAYDAAYALVRGRQYDRALDALAAFLVKWPDHPYADNAMYWRGECYFAKGDFLHASEQFEGVVTRFPAGNKAPDALLKLGVTHMKLGNPVKAKECFDRLATAYPQSDAAHRIPPVTVQAATPSGPAAEDHR